MAQSRISFNVHCQGGIDNGRLMAHLDKLNPAALVAMDGLGLAQQVKARFPDCTVIHRNYGITKGDDDVHYRVSPQQWIDLRGKEGDNGIYLYTTNEPSFTLQTIDWHCELMELAAPRGIHLAVGSWSVGNPGADDWHMARPMIDLLNANRSLFVLSLHEYGCGVITSGLEGGFPDNAGVQPGQPGGRNYIMPDKWPADTSKLTLWHCGRWRFLQNYCRANNLFTPRIVLTEHGLDDVSDIKAWAETLQKTPPYDNIRGWKTLRKQWEAWYGGLGWSPERAYAEMLLWADRAIYQGSPVEAQCIYSWGHSSDQWIQFDVAEAFEFQALLEAHAQKAVEVSPKLIERPTNATISRYARVNNSGGLNMRYGYGTTFHKLKGDTAPPEISKGDKVVYYLPSIHNIDRDWVYGCILVGENKGLEGWFSLTDLDAAPTKELPTIPPPDVTPPPVNPVVVREVRVKIAGVDQARVDAIGQLISTYLEATGAYVRSPELQFEVSKGD